MVSVFDKQDHWTEESAKFIDDITYTLCEMLEKGKAIGFTDADIFYMISTQMATLQMKKRLFDDYRV